MRRANRHSIVFAQIVIASILWSYMTYNVTKNIDGVSNLIPRQAQVDSVDVQAPLEDARGGTPR